MKNVNGTAEDLILYHKNGGVACRFEDSNGFKAKRTYDEKGNELTYQDSNGYKRKSTYDEKGNLLTYENSNGIYRVKGETVTKEEFESFKNRIKKRMKQTAMQMMYDELIANEYYIPLNLIVKCKKLIEMEKRQIIDAYKFGLQDEYVIGSEQYYYETFNK